MTFCFANSRGFKSSLNGTKWPRVQPKPASPALQGFFVFSASRRTQAYLTQRKTVTVFRKDLVLPHWFSLAPRDGVPRRSGAGAWRARLTAEAGEGWRTTLSYCTSCLGRGTGTLRPRGGALWGLPSPAARSGRGRTRTGRARAASGMRCAWREAPRAGAMRTCCDQWIVAHAQWLLWPLNIQILAVMS